MREFREYGSARGVLSSERPYRELAFLSPRGKSLWRQKNIAKGAEDAAAFDPDISGPQTVA